MQVQSDVLNTMAHELRLVHHEMRLLRRQMLSGTCPACQQLLAPHAFSLAPAA